MSTKNSFNTLASKMAEIYDTQRRFEDSLMGLFIPGKEILENYSKEELNKKVLVVNGNTQMHDITSNIIKDDKRYIVTNNTVTNLAFPGDHGLYRHHTWLTKDFKSEDGKTLNIRLQYKTQRDHSDSVDNGNELSLIFKDNELIDKGQNTNCKTYEYKDFTIIHLNASYDSSFFIVGTDNKVYGEFKYNGNSIEYVPIIKTKKIQPKTLIKFISDKLFERYVIAKSNDNNYEAKDISIGEFSKVLSLHDYKEIAIPDDLEFEKISITNCNLPKVNIPESNVKEFSLQHCTVRPKDLDIIPESIEKLTLTNIKFTKEATLDLKKFKNLKEFTYYCNTDSLITILLTDTLENVYISNHCIIKDIPNKKIKDFRFRADGAYIGYSDKYLLETDDKNIRKITTDDGISFLCNEYGFRSQEYILQRNEILEDYNISSTIKKWVKNLYNYNGYVKEMYDSYVEVITSTIDDTMIEPGTYHVSGFNFSNIKAMDIIEGQFIKRKDKDHKKYLVKSSSTRNDTVYLVPLDKRYDYTKNDIIQVTSTNRMECLMIDLFEVNRIPFRGWRRKEMKLKKLNMTYNPATDKEAIPEINTNTIVDLMDKKSLKEYLETWED